MTAFSELKNIILKIDPIFYNELFKKGNTIRIIVNILAKKYDFKINISDEINLYDSVIFFDKVVKKIKLEHLIKA